MVQLPYCVCVVRVLRWATVNSHPKNGSGTGLLQLPSTLDVTVYSVAHQLMRIGLTEGTESFEAAFFLNDCLIAAGLSDSPAFFTHQRPSRPRVQAECRFRIQFLTTGQRGTATIGGK